MVLLYILLLIILLPLVIFVLLGVFLPAFIRFKFGKVAREAQSREQSNPNRSSKGKGRRIENVHFNSDKGGEYTNFEEVKDANEDRK